MKQAVVFVFAALLFIPGYVRADILPEHYCKYNVGQDLSPSVVPENYTFVSELEDLSAELEKHGDLSKSWSWTAPKGCRARLSSIFPIVRSEFLASAAAMRATLSSTRMKVADKVIEDAFRDGTLSPEEALFVTELLDARKSYCNEQIAEAFLSLKQARNQNNARRIAARKELGERIAGCTELKQDIIEFFAQNFGEDI